MSVTDAAADRWRRVVQRTGAPGATGLVALMVAVTALQYLVLPAVGVPADGTLQHRLFYFDTGEPTRLWTVATSAFAHAGILHLAINAQLVLGFGSFIEPEDGTRRLLAAFAVGVVGALVAGFLLQVAVGGTEAYLGASGGAFGLLGWLAGHAPKRRLPTIPPGPAWAVAALVGGISVGVVVVLGAGAFDIAHVPHVGALLAGAIAGVLAR